MQYLGIAALVVIVATLARWFQLAWRVDLPPRPRAFQWLSVGALALGAAALFVNSGDAFALSAIGIAIFFLYLSFTGAQRSGEAMIGVGDPIPAFSAPDASGATFDSASLAGSRVLLKFFRGHW